VPGWLAVEPQRRERSPRPRAETDRLFVVKLVNREPAEAEKDVGHGELCFGSTTESEALFPLRAGGGHIPLTERDGGEVVQGALETYRSPSSRANARACSQRARPSAFLPRAARAEPSERGLLSVAITRRLCDCQDFLDFGARVRGRQRPRRAAPLRVARRHVRGSVQSSEVERCGARRGSLPPSPCVAAIARAARRAKSAGSTSSVSRARERTPRMLERSARRRPGVSACSGLNCLTCNCSAKRTMCSGCRRRSVSSSPLSLRPWRAYSRSCRHQDRAFL
jgi:hypothetical protein